MWDVETRRLLAELRGHISDIKTAVFSPDGNLVFTTGGDTARIWDVSANSSVELKHGTTILETKAYLDFDNETIQTNVHELTELGKGADIAYQSTEDKAFLYFYNKAQAAVFDSGRRFLASRRGARPG